MGGVLNKETSFGKTYGMQNRNHSGHRNLGVTEWLQSYRKLHHEERKEKGGTRRQNENVHTNIIFVLFTAALVI